MSASGGKKGHRGHWRRSETCFGKPVRPPPSAKTTEASAREAVAEALAVARKIVSGSPPSVRTTERARATARVCHGCRGSFGRRPENCFEKQRASSQRQNYGSERERRAPPRLDKTATAAGLDKVAILQALDKNGADKLLIRDNMKSAIRSPYLEICICPLLVDKTAFAATGRPRSPHLHHLETCFGKPVRPPPSAKTTEASAREAVAEALAVTRKIVSGSPAGQPPAPE